MTSLGSVLGGTTGFITLFGLRGPVSGNKVISASWLGGATTQVTFWAASWSGVNQASDAAAFPNFNTATGTGTQSSITITSGSGDATMAVHTTGNHSQNFNSVDNLTYATGTSAGVQNGGNTGNGSNYNTLGSNTTLNGNMGSSTWGALGVDIAAAGGASGGLRFNSNMDGLGASGGFFSNPLARVAQSFIGWRKRNGIFVPQGALA